MTPLFVFAVCIVAAIVVGTLRSLELAKPLATPLAKNDAPRVAALRPAAHSATPARAPAPVAHPEAA